MHDHECGDDCNHGPVEVARDLNEVLAVIGLFSLVCSRGSLESDIADAFEIAPMPKRRAARKAAIVEHQEEYWTVTESFKKAAKTAPVGLPPELRGAMQDVLGSWCEDDFGTFEWVQEELGTLLWAISAIDALPAITADIDPMTTAEAIARINSGACVPRLRESEEIDRTWKMLVMVRQRSDEPMRVMASGLARPLHAHDEEPEEPQEDEPPVDGGQARLREATLALARASGHPIESGDVVIDGRPFGDLSEADQRTAGFCAAARSCTLDWLIGEADSLL